VNSRLILHMPTPPFTLGSCFTGRPKPVTDSPYSLNGWRVSGNGLQFRSQPGDVDIHCSGVDEVTTPPHTVDQLATPKRPPILGGEHPQELKLLLAEPQLMATYLDFETSAIDVKSMDLDNVRLTICLHEPACRGGTDASVFSNGIHTKSAFTKHGPSIEEAHE
jgi:hypothetical protein